MGERTVPPVRHRLVFHPAYASIQPILTAVELLIRRGAACCCSHGCAEVVAYGASDPGVVVTGVDVFVKAVNRSPDEEAVEVAAGGL